MYTVWDQGYDDWFLIRIEISSGHPSICNNIVSPDEVQYRCAKESQLFALENLTL